MTYPQRTMGKLRNEQKKHDKESLTESHTYVEGLNVFLRDLGKKLGTSRKLQNEDYADKYVVATNHGQAKTKIKPQENNASDALDVLESSVQSSATRGTSNSEKMGLQADNPIGRRSSDHSDRKMVYRIVEQKGSGTHRTFRIQWKTREGKIVSVWDKAVHVSPEMVNAWGCHNDRNAKSRKEFRRTRRPRKQEI